MARRGSQERPVELAQWCHKQKAYLTRDKVYEALPPSTPITRPLASSRVHLRPQGQARWRPKAPKAGKAEVMTEAAAKRGIGDRYVEAIMDLIDEHGSARPVKAVANASGSWSRRPTTRRSASPRLRRRGAQRQDHLDDPGAGHPGRRTARRAARGHPDEQIEEDETNNREDAVDLEWSSPLTYGRLVRVNDNVDDEENTLIARAAVQWSIFRACSEKVRARESTRSS